MNEKTTASELAVAKRFANDFRQVSYPDQNMKLLITLDTELRRLEKDNLIYKEDFEAIGQMLMDSEERIDELEEAERNTYAAIEPIADWYFVDADSGEKVPFAEALSHAVEDMQSDRQDALKYAIQQRRIAELESRHTA